MSSYGSSVRRIGPPRAPAGRDAPSEEERSRGVMDQIGREAGARSRPVVGSGGGLLLALFMVSIIVPAAFQIGGLRLDLFRVYVMVALFPCLFLLGTGKKGHFVISDTFVLGFGVWVVVTIVMHEGMGKFAYAAISGVEYVGGYLAGRVLIRSAGDYRAFIRYFLIALLVIVPLALFEMATGRNIPAELFPRPFDPTEIRVDQAPEIEMRLGFIRAASVFPHPIIFGVFCSMAFANVFYIYRGSLFRLIPRLSLVGAGTFSALSSAPYLAIGVQVLLILWDKIMRGRWYLLLGLSAAAFIFLSIASNRGPFILIIETMTLNPRTAWWRVYVWIYGIQNVADNPIFGLGLGDWKRPIWLADTVDNFWLLMAMRHGIPGFAMLALTLLFHVIFIVRAKIGSPDTNNLRTAYMVGLAGMVFTLSTVHVWGSMASFVMFYIGAGSYLYTEDHSTPNTAHEPGNLSPTDSEEGQVARSSLSYTRFNADHKRR